MNEELTVLVADDEPEMTMVLEALLSRSFCRRCAS